MYKWRFPSCGYGGNEGFSEGGLADFKGNPLQSLAREICQNSMDAADGSGKPVCIEFEEKYIPMDQFPGMEQLHEILESCDDFWKEKADVHTKNFLRKALGSFDNNKMSVLRISDYNTKGAQGAFSDEDDGGINPWGSLVMGSSFSVKSDEKNAAGSYGIGKDAPYINSIYQTVFYRTYDIDEKRAVLGVARLMTHMNVYEDLLEGEDPKRRSVGYFGEDKDMNPAVSMPELDALNLRSEHGTDLFIPGFAYATSDETWVQDIMAEIVDNFLCAVYIGKLEVVVGNRTLNKSTLKNVLLWLGDKVKNASMFYKVIDSEDVKPVDYLFHGLGTLHLRLMYGNDLNRKILVVRSSGMKIARIPSLPRTLSYTGFLELQGDGLNEFFRKMENPRHDAWEPSRHENPKLAKKYKNELEEWVKSVINEKILEQEGDQSDVDTGDCFNFKEKDDGDENEENKIERLRETRESVQVTKVETTSSSTFKVRDIGGSGSTKQRGTIDDSGDLTGHRRRTGIKPGNRPTGRKGYSNEEGEDVVFQGKRRVDVKARVISLGNGVNKLIFTVLENLGKGELVIVTEGENGKSLQLDVKEVRGENAQVDNGHIQVFDVPANQKNVLEFKISGNKNYAMGVKAYGD